ncbi:hypothetical protein L1D54_22035 [Vibrio brasiliensis]|jgi:hypothetical protein|uniref:hypothetical protein n=1 Tax=Vibrio brasiliensis TaxID=170652 RepID=UPI001EFDDFC3|nr:hypothetical protein [Vibrio brasiliensis]MCG9753124.1 hypothetical protein [Vibrio brasiliensis]MCG9782909.1 hypothetical protein [Vibrio brasiliensis]
MRKTISYLTLAVCALFIGAGAVNQGVSGFLLALPFVAGFIFALKAFSFKSKVVYIAVVTIFSISLAWNHEENKIIYPWLGTDFVAKCGWEAVKFEQAYTGYDYYTLVPQGAEIEEQYVVSRHSIACDSVWKLTRVFARHPDLGTLYYPVFSIDGYEATMSGYQLNDAFSTKLLKHSQINSSYELQSSWTDSWSLLMMWPALPVYVYTGVMSIFI